MKIIVLKEKDHRDDAPYYILNWINKYFVTSIREANDWVNAAPDYIERTYDVLDELFYINNKK